MKGFLIHSPLEHHARYTPRHPALSLRGETTSYADLNAAANRLAHALIAHGARPRDRVGIYVHKSVEMAIGLYGALKAGCVFVPLDPSMPLERLAFILGDCGIEHLVSGDALAGTLSRLDGDTPLRIYGVEAALDGGTRTSATWSEIDAFPSHDPDVTVIDLELGYIMYTSGSTGAPKGMMHTHAGSIAYARWGEEHVGLTADDRVASHAPLHFDLSIFDFFSTLRAGATVVLVPEPVTRFPASWTQTVEEERVSVVFTVPYTLIAMHEHGAMDKRDLSSLRWILFGGEPYPPRKLGELMRRLDDVRFTNVYGPAEAPSCTCHDVTTQDVASDEPLPIGTVSRNSADLVVDEHGEPCPVGSAGELCIRSSTLTRGYWNRPDLNARAFLSREGRGPFPDVYFRTGDRVVRHADGLLRFLGRVDRMIKTRGHRVELDEVEAALTAHDGVAEAAAFTVPDGQGSRLVLAAATVRSGTASVADGAARDGDGTRDGNDAAPDEAALLRFVREKLPAYAVPQSVELLGELPRTTSGKIDRRALAGRHVPAAGDPAAAYRESEDRDGQ